MIDKLEDILLDLMIRHRYVLQVGENQYRFTCSHNKDSEKHTQCPYNEHGLCGIVQNGIPWESVRKYDGFKIYKCPCG